MTGRKRLGCNRPDGNGCWVHWSYGDYRGCHVEYDSGVTTCGSEVNRTSKGGCIASNVSSEVTRCMCRCTCSVSYA